jgi:two-component system, NtrC family, C4-dicarboxylate transport sensor histidine kinase DctB
MHAIRKDAELVENLEVILSTMRHQLGNSVNAIKVTLDVLKQNFDQFNDVKKRDYLDRGTQLLARQQVLIEAMKSYARFDVREQADIEVIPLWEKVAALAGERLRGSGVQLAVNSNLRPHPVRGNLMALDKIITSVLDNAIDAVEGSDSPRIGLEAVSTEEELVISVLDNGHGIRQADLHRIRIPLFSTKPGRAGMGLSIAHKLLSKMNGSMAIDSMPGEGTCVRMTLAATSNDDGVAKSP